MKKQKTARFFCEFCDTEVAGDTSFCPKCGRFFASVRCPACNFTGSHTAFYYGCPQCGYAMNGSSSKASIPAGTTFNTQNNPKKQNKFFRKKNHNKNNHQTYGKHNKKSNSSIDSGLPSWIYIVLLLLLLTFLKIAYDFLL